jgi:hypothetical protein
LVDEHLKKQETIILLQELSAKKLVQPLSANIEQRKLDRYQLKIKGSYDFELIEAYANFKDLSVKENGNKELIIFKP